jgi:Flp pilus assembly protein TadG
MPSATPAELPTQDQRPHNQRGSVTAEFVAVMPAVLMVLLICLASLQMAAHQLRLQDATSDAARALGRGESLAQAGGRLALAVPGASLSANYPVDLVCAVGSIRPSGLGVLMGITLRARSCAMGDGL